MVTDQQIVALIQAGGGTKDDVLSALYAFRSAQKELHEWLREATETEDATDRVELDLVRDMIARAKELGLA